MSFVVFVDMTRDPDARAAWAAAHGLRRSTRDYWTAILGRRWNAVDMATHHSWNDHGEVWTRSRRAVCYTAHPYDEPNRADLDALAATHGITYEIHPPAASWYYPGSTWLVVLWAPEPSRGGYP